MTKLNPEQMIPRLISEFGYPEHGARMAADKLATCRPDIWAAFVVWWEHGEMSDLEVEGFTVERLMAEQSLKPIAAFLTLDWLAREPEKALAAIRRGYDRVGEASP